MKDINAMPRIHINISAQRRFLASGGELHVFEGMTMFDSKGECVGYFFPGGVSAISAWRHFQAKTQSHETSGHLSSPPKSLPSSTVFQSTGAN